MRSLIQFATVVLILGLVHGCKSTGIAYDQDDLPIAGEMTLVSPAEAAEITAAEITNENLDEEFEDLVAELEKE